MIKDLTEGTELVDEIDVKQPSNSIDNQDIYYDDWVAYLNKLRRRGLS